MSAISKRFQLETTEDALWVIGIVIGSIITMCTLFSFILVIQNLYCIPYNPILASRPRQFQPKHSKFNATLSVAFSTICVLLIFSTYPICTQYHCGYNLLGNVYYNFILDFYILAKLFLYFLFIGRLFNTHYKQIYKYPNWIQYLLYIVMCIIIMTIIISNIASFYNFKRHNLNHMIIIWVCAYICADFILSAFTLVLFLRPLWSKDKLHISAEHSSVVRKYIIISLLQTITAMIYGGSLIIRFIFGWFDSQMPLSNSYLDLCNLIQMLDMLMTIICIYLGFGKKHTYTQCCDLCELYLLTCCCSCCCGDQISYYYRDQNWNRFLLQNQLDSNREDMTSITTNMNVKITSVQASSESTVKYEDVKEVNTIRHQRDYGINGDHDNGDDGLKLFPLQFTTD